MALGPRYRFSETRTYNDDNTLASVSFSGAPVGDLSYTWDANKNKTSESIGGVMSGYGFTAGYDAEDRLTSWDRADASLDQSWELSPVGDWNSITENASVQNRTHGPVHEILTAGGQSVEHDAKGNMTSIPSSLRPTASPLALTWDFDNKLRAADTDNDGIDDVFYRWDALGRRVGRDDGTTHVIYFQDGQQTLADYPAGGAASSPTYTYVYGSYIDEVVLRNEGGGTRYYHRNQQYSIIALTDAARSIVERYAYTAYGQVTFANASGTVQAASASNNRYTYTGREWDAGLNLYHFRARMYDAVAGRFLSRDPIRYRVSVQLYLFLESSPASRVDPLGNQSRNPTVQQASRPTNQQIKDACYRRQEQEEAPDSHHSPGTTWPANLTSDCDNEVASLFRNRSTEMHRRLRRLKGDLVTKGCNVDISCQCCDEKLLGGRFEPSGSRIGAIGAIKLCANNLNNSDYLPFLVHEMTHAAQWCHERPFRGCTNSLKLEMEAYHCQGVCSNARDCLLLATQSSCRTSCHDIYDETIEQLVQWYDTNNFGFCLFPRTDFDPQDFDQP